MSWMTENLHGHNRLIILNGTWFLQGPNTDVGSFLFPPFMQKGPKMPKYLTCKRHHLDSFEARDYAVRTGPQYEAPVWPIMCNGTNSCLAQVVPKIMEDDGQMTSTGASH